MRSSSGHAGAFGGSVTLHWSLSSPGSCSSETPLRWASCRHVGQSLALVEQTPSIAARQPQISVYVENLDIRKNLVNPRVGFVGRNKNSNTGGRLCAARAELVGKTSSQVPSIVNLNAKSAYYPRRRWFLGNRAWPSVARVAEMRGICLAARPARRLLLPAITLGARPHNQFNPWQSPPGRRHVGSGHNLLKQNACLGRIGEVELRVSGCSHRDRRRPIREEQTTSRIRLQEAA